VSLRRCPDFFAFHSTINSQPSTVPEAGNQPLTPNPAPFRPRSRSPPRPRFGSPFPSCASVEFPFTSLGEFTRVYASLSESPANFDPPFPVRYGVQAPPASRRTPGQSNLPRAFFWFDWVRLGLTWFDRANCGVGNPAIFADLRLPSHSRHQTPNPQFFSELIMREYAGISGIKREAADFPPAYSRLSSRLFPPSTA
jgi:hypothetical protein